jgi:hypothetical protein
MEGEEGIRDEKIIKKQAQRRTEVIKQIIEAGIPLNSLPYGFFLPHIYFDSVVVFYFLSLTIINLGEFLRWVNQWIAIGV